MKKMFNYKSPVQKKKVTKTKTEYLGNKKRQKKFTIQRVKRYLKLISFKNLNYRIQSFGYDYSLAKYITSIVLLMSIIVISGKIFHLKYEYIIPLALFALILLPIIVLSQIKFLYNNFRFEQITTYLQEMITIFKMNPKILYALKEVQDLFETKQGINQKIDEAIYHIEYGKSEDNSLVYAEALSILEEAYPCSRIKSLHSLLLSVENQNSVDYEASLNDLYDDIRCWIARTYDYQIQLKNTKFQFSLILLLTIFVSSAMTNILPSSMTGFINSSTYQITSTLLLGIFLAMFSFVQSKLNGQWLVNDIEKDDNRILRSIQYIEKFDKKKNFNDSCLKAALASILPFIGVMQKNSNMIFIGLLITVFMYFWGELQYKSHFKIVEREIKKTFPIWLRDITINMHNLIVTNAIRQSYTNAPTVLKYYLTGFLDEIEKDPITIRPYNNFLKKFYITDISSAMKSLYSIKQQSPEDSSRQISDIIIRNQGLMETSERIKNENQIAGMSLIGGVPMIAGCIKLTIDMVLMLGSFMSSIQMPV